jgi:hypothetical protein
MLRIAADPPSPERTHSTGMSKRSVLARAPEHCPCCGEPLRFGLSEQNSVGPGPEGRFIRALAVPLGVLASVAVAMSTRVGWTAGHLIFGTGMVVGFLILKAGDTCLKTWRIRCRACKWQAEVAEK